MNHLLPLEAKYQGMNMEMLNYLSLPCFLKDVYTYQVRFYCKVLRKYFEMVLGKLFEGDGDSVLSLSSLSLTPLSDWKIAGLPLIFGFVPLISVCLI